MPYYNVVNLVTVTKTNMTDETPCGYGTLRTTAVRIRHQVSRRTAQRSQLLLKSPADLHMLGRDLAQWLVWRSGAVSPRWPKAAGMWPVACFPHGPPPALMPRSRGSPGIDARHQSPDVILGFAKYALSFPIYIRLSFSLFAL